MGTPVCVCVCERERERERERSEVREELANVFKHPLKYLAPGSQPLESFSKGLIMPFHTGHTRHNHNTWNEQPVPVDRER